MDSLFVAYLSFAFAFAITPGATTALVVRNTLRGDRGAGLATAAGAAVANASYGVVTGVGLSALLARWPPVFAVVRMVGAAYLGWLGAQSLWRVARHADGGLHAPVGHGAGVPTRNRLVSFREGLGFNLLNPAITSFYLAVVPSFMPAGASTTRFALMAGAHVCLAFGCHASWALALDAIRRVFWKPARRRMLEAATGLALIVLAVRVWAKG